MAKCVICGNPATIPGMKYCQKHKDNVERFGHPLQRPIPLSYQDDALESLKAHVCHDSDIQSDLVERLVSRLTSRVLFLKRNLPSAGVRISNQHLACDAMLELLSSPRHAKRLVWISMSFGWLYEQDGWLFKSDNAFQFAVAKRLMSFVRHHRKRKSDGTAGRVSQTTLKMIWTCLDLKDLNPVQLGRLAYLRSIRFQEEDARLKSDFLTPSACEGEE